MKIDFAKTRQAVRGMLDEALASFRQKHPDVRINKLTLWGYGFGGVAHVLLETNDDKRVFGERLGEYNDNEFGPGVRFVDGWPDLHACAEGEPYEILLENGKVVKTYQSKEGNDAIDKPLFQLLKEVLKEADLRRVKKGKPIVLSVEMGDSPLAESWQ